MLDSWAVLALLDGVDPAAGIVDEVLGGSDEVVMSWINLGEVVYVVTRRYGEGEARAVVRDLRPAVRLLVATPRIVLDAASLKARHRVSHADAFAAATAASVDGELLTGDAELLVAGASWRWRDLR